MCNSFSTFCVSFYIRCPHKCLRFVLSQKKPFVKKNKLELNWIELLFVFCLRKPVLNFIFKSKINYQISNHVINIFYFERIIQFWIERNHQAGRVSGHLPITSSSGTGLQNFEKSNTREIHKYHRYIEAKHKYIKHLSLPVLRIVLFNVYFIIVLYNFNNSIYNTDCTVNVLTVHHEDDLTFSRRLF